MWIMLRRTHERLMDEAHTAWQQSAEAALNDWKAVLGESIKAKERELAEAKRTIEQVIKQRDLWMQKVAALKS